MRVRNRRFRSGGQDFSPPHDAIRRLRPRHPMLPIGLALTGFLARSGVIGSDILSVVGCQPTSSALHETSRLPVSSFLRTNQRPRLVVPLLWSRLIGGTDFPRHFLRGISPGKNACLRHTTAPFTCRIESNGFAVWCQLTQSERPFMRFLSCRAVASAKAGSSAHGSCLVFLQTVGYPSALDIG
jgi:hypothetical protein